MSIVFSEKVFASGLVANGSTYYTDPNFNALIASAERYFIQARGSQTTGSAITFTVTLQSSFDGVDWSTKATLINSLGLTAGVVTYQYGTDTGTTPGGTLMRLKIDLAGTSPVTYLELWLTGRTND